MASNQKTGTVEDFPFPGTFGAKFYEVTPKSWSALQEYHHYLPNFIFRGQTNNKWKLMTSIERAAIQYECPPDEIWDREKYVIKEFKARAHHFIISSPSDTDILEWLSIIQDYGGPTRLLDFTDSLYIASFFAVESSNDDSCVWAINSTILQMALRMKDAALHVMDTRSEGKFLDDKEYDFYSEGDVRFAESFIIDPSKKRNLVLQVKPPRLNERLAVQKGLFLFPCNLSTSFENNLCQTLTFPFETLDSSNASDSTDLLERLKQNELDHKIDTSIAVIKFNIPKYLHKHMFMDLQNMNINAASLFPGLEGFAKSLNFAIRFSQRSYRVQTRIVKRINSRPSDKPDLPTEQQDS